jgi:small-conductance mechanosensitive channel
MFSRNIEQLTISLYWQSELTVLQKFWGYITQQFTFGRITVSLSSLVIGLLVLILSIFIARSICSLIENRMAKRGHIDPGLRYTITRLVKYALLTVGFLIALKQAFAIDLTSIAVVFTALSVGIGFGLQYIAADIASGFILLFERPIRVGDRITIEQDEGDVRSINLRTTTVVTNDRISIIVPNSKLVSQRVINWSYGDPRARISIPVGVAYSSDIDLVRRTLLEAAEGIDRVLADPAPNVQFLAFGDYSLNFRLLVWSREPNRHPQIRSDINYRIAQLFRERGIVIPYPVHELRVRSNEDETTARSLIERDQLPKDGD